MSAMAAKYLPEMVAKCKLPKEKKVGRTEVKVASDFCCKVL
jgi:hypothetical protein